MPNVEPNTPRRRYGVADVHRSYPPEKALDERLNQWSIYYTLRFLSFYLAPILLNVRIHPNAVTLASLGIALAMPFAALPGLPHAAFIVAGMGVVFTLLDCVDGDMARTAGLSSRLGAYLDFFADIAYRATSCLALGILASNEISGNVWFANHAPAFGLAAALIALTARSCRLYLARVTQDSEVYSLQLSKGYGLTDRLFFFFSGLDYLLPVFIVIAALIHQMQVVLIWLLFYFTLDFITSQYLVWKKI